MKRDQMEAAILGVYAARNAGNLGDMAPFLHDAMVYRFMGESDHDGDTMPMASTKTDALAVFGGFIAAFKFTNWKAHALVAEGDRAVLHWSADVTGTATGQKRPFDVCALFEFRDGKIASLKEFTDTAGVSALAGAGR